MRRARAGRTSSCRCSCRHCGQDFLSCLLMIVHHGKGQLQRHYKHERVRVRNAAVTPPRGRPNTPDANPWGYGDRLRSLEVLRLVPPRGSARRPRPSLHRLLGGEFAGFHGTRARCNSLPPFHRAALPALGDTRRCVGGFAPVGPERPTAGQGFVCRSPLPARSAWRRSGYPKFLENLPCLFALFLDAGRTADTRPIRCRSVAPGR